MLDTLATLYDIAETQAGYFTLAQAQAAGVLKQYVQHHLRSGRVLRLAHGIYRLRQFPAQRFEDLVVTCLWAGSDAAISHQSALSVYELADVMPAVIHVTVPRPFRGRRAGVLIHHSPIAPKDVSRRDSVRVTSVERTLADVAEEDDPALATAAAREALARGVTTQKRAREYLRQRPSAWAVLGTAIEGSKG